MAKKKNTLKPVGTYAQEMQNNLTKKQNTVGAYSDRLNMLKNSIDKIKAQQEQKRAEEERQRQIRQQAMDETRKMQTLSRDLQYGYGQKYDPALAYQAAQMGVKADKLRGMVEEDEKTYNALNRLAKEAEALKDTGYAGIQKDRKNYNTGNTLTLDQWFRVQGKQRDNQAERLYDNGDDPMLMSQEGRAAYRTQAENWVKHYKDQAKRYTDYNEDDALAGLFDRMYERDIANEQAIINNTAYKGTAYETTAQGRLATLESERNEARRQAVENARRMRDSGMSLKGATPEEQEKIRREVYDWILPDGYDQRTAQNKAEIDAAIDEYITGVRSPWGDSRTQADAINAANSQAAAWESRIQAADEAQKYYDLKNKWMGYAADDTFYNQSNEYVPEYAPQMRMNFDDESRRFEIEIQGDEVAKAYWYANNYQSMKGLQDSPDYANKYMFIASDPDILRTFNEMYNKDMANGYRGQRGSNLAEQFLKGLEPYLSTMLVNYQNDFFRSRAEDPAAGIAGRIISPALQAAGGVAGTLGAITGAKKDSPLYTTSRLVSELRSQQNEDVGKWADRVIGDGSGDVAKFVLGVADSIADNIFAMGTGTALAGEGTKGAMRIVQAIMSGSATSNKMIENLDAGMDPTEAALSAVGNGVIEWLTERYSLEQIMGPDIRQLYGNGRAMTSFLARSAGAEGSEEIASGVLNAGLDSILSMVYGHEDEITSRYNELVTSNPTMSHEEASRIAMEEKLQEIGLEGLAGSLSGLAMSGSRAISTALETRAEGRTVKSNDGGIDTMLNLAQKMKEGTESRTLADKLSAEIEKGSKVSNYDLGRLANLTALDVGETRSQVIRDTVGRNVEKQLTDAGIGEQEAKKYGEIITRSIFEGKRLSKSDIQTLGQDERAIKLWGDFNTMSQASLNLSKEVKAETKELDSIAQKVGELTSEQTGEESAAAAEVQKSIQETGSTEEAIDNLQARRSGLISEGYANLAKQVLKDNPLAKKSKTYLDDIMKIRLAAMTMDQLPKTALDKDVAQRFYDAAKAEFDEEDANRVVPQAPAQEGRGSATFEGAEYGTQAWKDATQGLSKMTRNVMGAVGEIAARFGNRVNLVNDPENPDIYGFEDANTGAITINVANGFKHHMLVTLAHEMTHWLEQNSRGGYNDLRSFVLDSLRKEGVNVQDRIVKIMDNYNMVMGEKAGSGLTINQAMAELIAQSSEGLLSSRNTMQALKDTNTGLFSKVREYVKDVVARINAAIRGMEYESSLSQEAKALKNYRDQLASIWLEGRKDTQGNTPAERAEEQAEENTEKQPDINIQYKLAEYSQNEINNWKNSNRIVVYDEPETLLNFVEEAKTNKQFVKKIYLGKIDSKLSNLLTKWYPFKTEGYNLALHANEVRKAFDRHGEEDPRTNHVALSNDSFLDIIETVQNPDYVNQSNKYNGQPAIQFTKTLANKAVVVVYAVPRLHDLHIQAFHEEKIGTNKESLSQADDAKSPSLSTSETTLSTTLKQSIAQGNETENRQNGTKSFSLANAVEERQDGLVAVHNLEAGNLLKSLKLGGFAMPSIAIVRSSNPYNKYGKISVVFGPDTIDPKAISKNKVYGGDAWTPVYPKVEYKLNNKKLDNIRQKILDTLPEQFRRRANLVDLYEVNLSENVNRFNGAEDITKAIGSDGMEWLRIAYMQDTGKQYDIPSKQGNLDTYGTFDNNQVIHMAEVLGRDIVEEATKDSDAWRWAIKHPEVVEQIRTELNDLWRSQLKDDGKESKFLKRIREMGIYNENNYNAASAERMLNAIKRYYDKGVTDTIDIDALNKNLKETIDENDFNQWVNNLFKGVIEKSGLRNNKDYYTNAGNPRSWEALHDEETLDNVVRIMREQSDKGENAFFGQSAILAQGTRDFKSLDEVREHKDQLQTLDADKYSELKNNIVDPFGMLMDQLADRRESNYFIARDRVIDAIADAVKISRTVNGITKVMNQWGYHPTVQQVQTIINLMEEIANLPTEYFEAKPQRAVDLDEIARVIVPEGTDQALIDALDNAGIDYVTYDGTDEDRLAKLNAVPNVQFSIRQSPDMEVNNFMLGLNEFNLPTYQEKTMLRQYKDSRTRADLLRYGIREREIERKKLLAKEKRSIKDNKRLGVINRFLDRDRAKLDSLEKELVRVTGDKGYARLMMNQENIMKNLTTGQSAAELEETVNNIQQNLDNVTKEMAERAEELKKLASAEAVVKIRQQFNARGLKDIAAKLKGQLNSELENKEIENRLALIALKMKAGQYDAENAEELADLLAGRMKAEYDGYVISELRGSTITLGPVQLKELKGSGRSLNDIRQQLAGTGIRIGVNGSTTLDSKWDDLCKVIPSLNPEENVGNQLDALLKLINDEKAMRKTVYTDENLMNINRMVLEAAQQLIPEIITDEKSLKLIRESMALVAKVSGAAKSNAEAMDEINSLIEKLQKRGKRAIIQAKKLTGDIESTIEYFDQLSLQSEAAMWKSERIRLIEQMKSDNTKALMEEADRWRERIEKDKAFREAVGENQLIRRKITTNTSRIRKLLINETDLKNIPEHMKGLARELLGKIVNNDLAGRKITNIEKQDLIETARVLAAMKELDGEYSPDDLWLIADEEAQSVIADALADLEEGLEEYNGRRKGTKDVNVKTVHDQLQKVLDAVTTITGIINAERSVSFLDRQVTVGEAADDVRRDFENTRFRGELKGPGSKAITMAKRTVVYGNMTPEYYIENLRNRGMTELWKDMKRGENRNGLEVRKAQEHMARLAEETGYKAWANEKHDVTLGGMKRTLTIGNMMELYAIWQREHTSNPEMSQHLNKGGVYFQEEEKQTGKLRHEQSQQRAIRVTDEEIQAMYDSMTPQQKQLIDGVVKYLSNDMSDLGNEASMRMYGIKKYKETYYFPMKVWDGVKSARSDKGITGTDENRAAHKSWSKRRQHMAQNALVIGDFMTDAVNHIVEMINYNTMAPSIENINKVLNYKFTEEAGTDNETQRNLRVMFQENYGTESLKYLEDLLKDLNGGPAQDQRKTLRDRLLSVFKKNAVAGSMSVALQQPLSYIRAAMMISPKYLAEGLGKFWKGSYEEMITHSGVAVIKDMGRFDMNFGQSAKDYITPETGRNLYEKASDMLTKAPELMDRMTWTRMWSAVKAEQAAKNPGMDIKSEAFMNKVTERFNELMRKTQVYDSILVKSSNMRSTNLGMKVITSFMAEPTLSLNVLADAVRNAGTEGGKTKLAKAGATFLLSAVMQAVVKGLMGSGRTPDKKKTWTENFLNKLQQNLINEANPISLVPGYSDIIEVLKTGELKDDAMGAIGKLFSIGDTLRKAAAGNGKGGWRDVEDTFGQFVQLFTNIPLKNLMRDGRAMYNWASGSEYAQRPTSSAVLSYQFEANNFTADNIIGTLNAWLGEAGFKTTNASYYSRIYQAQKNGNAGEAAGLKEYLSLGKGASDDAIKAGIKAAAKKDTSMTEAERDAWMIDNDLMGENNASTITTQYKEGKITRAEAEKLYRKLNSSLTDNDLWWKLDRLDYQKETGADSVSGYSYRLKDAIQSNKAEEIRKVIKAMLDHGRTQKQIKDALSDWKSEYLAADAKTKTTIRDALQKAYKALGLTAADADKVINGWTKQKTKKTK